MLGSTFVYYNTVAMQKHIHQISSVYIICFCLINVRWKLDGISDLQGLCMMDLTLPIDFLHFSCLETTAAGTRMELQIGPKDYV